MLNRRKYPNDIDDNHDTEVQALLNANHHSTHDAFSSSCREVATAQDETYVNVGQYANFDPSSSSPIRKLHGKPMQSKPAVQAPIYDSPVHIRQATIARDSTYRTYGDSYELSRVGSTSNTGHALDNDEYRFKQQTNYMHYTIQPGDTLQNLSVRYSCPVASIKRINNLWSDQEFYGLSKLRLPLGRLKLLADVLHENDDQQSNERVRLSQTSDLRDTQFDSTRGSSVASMSQNSLDHSSGQFIRANIQNEFRDNRTDSLFHDLDSSIEKARIAAKSYDENASAIMQTLAQTGNIVDDSDLDRRAQTLTETPLNDLSEFGLSYNFLILFIFIICLVCPLAYVIYLEETHHRDQHHQNQGSPHVMTFPHDDSMYKIHDDP